MTSRKKHTPKMPQEQEYYSRTLRLIESEPTSDETLEFPHTDDLKEDEVPPPPKKRRRTRMQTVRRYFKNSRNTWIMPLVVTASVSLVILLLTNVIDIKQQLGRFEGILQGISDTLKRHDNDISQMEKDLRNLQNNSTPILK